jgi:hypothetical protein
MLPTAAVLLTTAANIGLVVAHAQVLPKYVTVPLSRGSGLEAYYAELAVGTPPQKSRLLADTGSPTFSFEDPRNPICQPPYSQCAYYGTFNNLTSSYVQVPMGDRGV